MKNQVRAFALLCAMVAIAGCGEQKRSPASAPMLLLGTAKDFGLFAGEILKAEGFNEFQTDSLNSPQVSPAFLKGFDVVILAPTPVTDSQERMLARYVEEGGNLIAFRPDKKLSDIFGIRDAGGQLSDGYLFVDADNEIGKGITQDTLQFHGAADKYSLADGQPIAFFYSDEDPLADLPAVVSRMDGNGEAIAFLYNLPESVALTRQGNYRHAGLEMDGIPGIRAMDLFTGWVDPSKNTLNQADEQMRLLTHCVEVLTRDIKPLPRFWYFPDTLNCVVTLNNDGEDSKENEFVKQFDDVDAQGAKMTLYIKEVEFVSRTWVDKWTAKGFEIGGHPDDTRQAENPEWRTMDSVYTALNNELKSEYGLGPMQTVTNHWFVWVGRDTTGRPDFAAQAKIEERHGVGLDCNYAHYDNGSTHGHFLGESGINQGNYTGSGLPMKFVDMNGTIIHVYQQLNNVYDQQYMEHKDQDGYFHAFKGLMDRSLDEEVYSTISVKAHNNEYYFSEMPLMKMLAYAKNKGIPVWTELELLEFLRMKDEAVFDNLAWKDSNTMAFRIKSSLKNAHGLTWMIPAGFSGKKIRSISCNGASQPFSIRPLKGFEYAWVTIKGGRSYDVEVTFE
ncbi:MAG TPA: hypothetical protein VF490_07400 [Chryseosolibacter sp.]